MPPIHVTMLAGLTYRARVKPNTNMLPQALYLFPPFFLAATTLKLPATSSFKPPCCPPTLCPPFFATSLHPPPVPAFASAGLAELALVSMMPLSASLRRLKNSSAKWRESIVCETECTASVTRSSSGGHESSPETISSAKAVPLSQCYPIYAQHIKLRR